MVITTVPAGTSQSAGASNSTPGVGRRCAGEKCEKPVARKGKGGKGGLDRFCADCRASITGSTASPSQPSSNLGSSHKNKEHTKRTFENLSPGDCQLEPKKLRVSVNARDFSVFLDDLESARSDELVDRIRQLVAIAQDCLAEKDSIATALKSTEEAFNAYRIAFADETFRSLTAGRIPASACATPSPPESSTLVVTVNEAAASEEVNTETFDRLLDSSANGPVPQIVKRKKGKVYISFSDAVQSGIAKALIKSKPECSRLFDIESVSTQTKLFPAVALHVDVTDLDTLKKEITFRNPSVGHSIKLIRTIFRSPLNTSVGHVKLFFDDKRTRDEVLKAGRLFAAGKRLQVVQVDPNREVRRCFRCQTYGHIAKSAANACSNDEVCGFCAGPHSSSLRTHRAIKMR